MEWAPDRPYNELPQLPPPGVDLETKAVLKATAAARAALAALDQAVRRIPNPVVLVNAIPLLEAQASSEIENIVTTTDDLFRFAQHPEDAASPEVKETLRYRSALFAGVQSIESRPLTASTALEVCTRIKDREMRVRDLPGTFIGNPLTREAIYTPPEGRSRITAMLGNWERFIHERRVLDPLVILAVQHYQFEAIHPFADGNGRTGRILNVLLLMDAGLLHQPVLYLSRFIIEHKDEYYRRLLEVTRSGAWEPWILFVIEGVRSTALGTLEKIDRIQELQQGMKEEITSVTRAGPNSVLLEVLFEQPYCRIANVIERCGVSRPTAAKWLSELVEAGSLVDIRLGRDRLFINRRFLEILAGADPRLETSADPTLF
ncbi:MAG: Fic family protein [Leucobacter sp.]